MTKLASPAPELQSEADRRRHRRIDVTLRGRYMRADHKEFPCETLNISAGGVALQSAFSGAAGERVVAYLERIGRIEGRVVRSFDAGFAMELSTPSLKHEKLNWRVASLTQKAEREPERRRAERVAYEQWRTIVVDGDGRQYAAAIVDLSPGGAAIRMDAAPPVGAEVTVSGRRARVARRTVDGVAVEFLD
jgi:hypothetical protein